MISNNYSKDSYVVFEQIFNNKRDLIDYLNYAKTSSTFIGSNLNSQNTSPLNAEWTKTGSFEEALSLFENGWYEDYDNFLILKKQIDKYFPYIVSKKEYYNHICGGVPNVFNAINNLPLTMRKKYDNNNSQKIITINYNYAYPYFTSQKQIFTNGLLTLSLIDFFDSIGYRVDLQFYDVSKNGNQIFHNKIILRESGEKINLQKLYFSFCNPSFLRRIIFRVIETTEGLSDYWTYNYGLCMEAKEIKELFNIDDNTIFINWPNKMGIKGENIEDDVKAFLDTIVLDKYFSVDEDKFNVFDEKNVLKKTKR